MQIRAFALITYSSQEKKLYYDYDMEFLNESLAT